MPDVESDNYDKLFFECFPCSGAGTSMICVPTLERGNGKMRTFKIEIIQKPIFLILKYIYL